PVQPKFRRNGSLCGYRRKMACGSMRHNDIAS
ncbi:uncharacterized protein METZ01_LOCUS373395, partial [marine metagenome]